MDEDGSIATSYTTLAGDHVREIEIRRSRFIAYLRRSETEDEARALVAELRKTHFDARHHCSAFVIGPDRAVQRSSDDGEPSGTAGAPMLEALTRRETAPGRADLSDTAVVVVRYFGGVLLGAGGLVRAYSGAVSAALDDATLVHRRRMRLFGIAADHARAGRLENELRAFGTEVLGTEYQAAAATLRVALPDEAEAVAAFAERLATLTAGAATAVPGGVRWVDVP